MGAIWEVCMIFIYSYMVSNENLCRLMMGLKDDLLKTFNDKFGINEDVAAILGKFNDLKTFITPNDVPKNLKTLQVASEKFLKSLLGAVDDLREANEDAAETKLVF